MTGASVTLKPPAKDLGKKRLKLAVWRALATRLEYGLGLAARLQASRDRAFHVLLSGPERRRSARPPGLTMASGSTIPDQSHEGRPSFGAVVAQFFLPILSSWGFICRAWPLPTTIARTLWLSSLRRA